MLLVAFAAWMMAELDPPLGPGGSAYNGAVQTNDALSVLSANGGGNTYSNFHLIPTAIKGRVVGNTVLSYDADGNILWRQEDGDLIQMWGRLGWRGETNTVLKVPITTTGTVMFGSVSIGENSNGSGNGGSHLLLNGDMDIVDSGGGDGHLQVQGVVRLLSTVGVGGVLTASNGFTLVAGAMTLPNNTLTGGTANAAVVLPARVVNYTSLNGVGGTDTDLLSISVSGGNTNIVPIANTLGSGTNVAIGTVLGNSPAGDAQGRVMTNAGQVGTAILKSLAPGTDIVVSNGLNALTEQVTADTAQVKDVEAKSGANLRFIAAATGFEFTTGGGAKPNTGIGNGIVLMGSNLIVRGGITATNAGQLSLLREIIVPDSPAGADSNYGANSITNAKRIKLRELVIYDTPLGRDSGFGGLSITNIRQVKVNEAIVSTNTAFAFRAPGATNDSLHTFTSNSIPTMTIGSTVTNTLTSRVFVHYNGRSILAAGEQTEVKLEEWTSGDTIKWYDVIYRNDTAAVVVTQRWTASGFIRPGSKVRLKTQVVGAPTETLTADSQRATEL